MISSYRYIFVYVFIFYLSIHLSWSYRGGAPNQNQVCSDMTPQHGASFQTAKSPYSMNATFNGTHFIVEIIGSVFDGFMVKGFDSSNTAVGKFKIGNAFTQLICTDTAITQNKKLSISRTSFYWDPSGLSGAVHFIATVIQSKMVFWKVQSQTYSIPYVSNSFTAPTATQHAYTTTNKQQTTCSKGTSCFSCSSNVNCFVSWSPGEDNYVDFFVSASVSSTKSYISIAFSKDNSMGDDSVVLCWNSSGLFKAEMWYTQGKSISRNTNPLESLKSTSIRGSYSNAKMSCSFSKQISKTASKRKRATSIVYYLDESRYYLFFATGLMNGDTPQQHEKRSYSSTPLNFTDFNTRSISLSNSNSLIKAHGILMVIAWLIIASTAILLPRYFKSAWPAKKILKKPIWFIGHQSLMVFVFTLTAIAFIIIFCEANGYAQFPPSETMAAAHPPLGIIVMILVFINPVMSLFRCDGGHKNRWIFNVFHTLVGEMALVASVVAIFLSFYISKANIGDWVKWVMVALICWHVLMELLLYAHEKCFQPKALSTNDQFVSTGLNIYENGKEKRDKKSFIKTILVHSHWIGVTCLSIAICVGIGVA